MAEEGRYPKRKLSIENPLVTAKPIHHYCSLLELLKSLKLIGEDVLSDIKNNSQLGVILKFAEGAYKWASKPVEYLLGNRLETAKKNEMWALADGRPIRFSLHEFEHITQLKCGSPDPEEDSFLGGDFRGIFAELELPSNSGPNRAELEQIVNNCKHWSFDNRRMVGLLVVLSRGLLGLHNHSRIPVKYVKLVTDTIRFESHPWGRVGFSALLTSIQEIPDGKSALNLKGFLHVLLVWALEYIPGLGDKSGGKVAGDCPLMHWRDSNSRGLVIEDVFEEDKKFEPQKKVTFFG